ncbi:hypothetical protein A2U01_0000875, partial [Trifolium medium]|nr:hypothetical protein [Trifolium medium]
VDRWKSNVHEAYDTYEQAEYEYIEHCKRVGRQYLSFEGKQTSAKGECSHGNDVDDNSGCQTDLTTNLAERTSSGDIILQWSIQKQLQIVCSRLRIPEPTYQLHEVIVDHGIQYVRYEAYLSTPLIGPNPVSIGSFATSEYDAREDVAVLLLHRVLRATGQRIRDYNHYNIKLIEDHLKETVYENFQLRMEIAAMKAEMNVFNDNFGRESQHWPLVALKMSTVFVNNGVPVTEPLIATESLKEVTLNDIMDAIKILNNRLDCMELCSKDMIKCYLRELQSTAVQSPNDSYKDQSLDSSSGYSPENAAAKNLKTSVQKTTLNREKAVNKGMEKLKNFGTITISDTDDENAKQKKRTMSKGTFVRADQQRKRQNTDLPRVEINQNSFKGKEPDENFNKPFNSDYRRGVNEQGSIPTFSAIPRRLTFTQGEGSNQKSSLGQGQKLGCSPKSVVVKKRSPVARAKGGVPIGRTNAFRNS